MLLRRGMRKLILLMTFSLSSGAWAASGAELLEMSSISNRAYGQNFQNVYLKILVPNVSFEKNVSVIFQREGGSAQLVVARYLGPADAGREIWVAYAPIGPGNQRVQIDYAEAPSNGERPTWLLREGAGPLLFDERAILSIYEQPVVQRGAVRFQAAVKNLAYSKRVRVHYSSDGWKTVQTMELHYEPVFSSGGGSVSLPNQEGFEIWSGTPHLAEDVDEVNYYLSYEVGGQVYIDNNFGQTYTLHIR